LQHLWGAEALDKHMPRAGPALEKGGWLNRPWTPLKCFQVFFSHNTIAHIQKKNTIPHFWENKFISPSYAAKA